MDAGVVIQGTKSGAPGVWTCASNAMISGSLCVAQVTVKGTLTVAVEGAFTGTLISAASVPPGSPSMYG